ncbi:MAG: hypothetical protein JNN15_13280 [Blastocatellia bacterium]|nr:hypothetical protein [Blastocatellia bacterium]
MICHRCKAEIAVNGRPMRSDVCISCGSDLKACLNCNLYDQFSPNQCREPYSDPVRDKEKANFCDFFQPNQKRNDPFGSPPKSKADQAREAFNNLFKKS